MPVKQQIPFDTGHFFITFTCYNWILLIDITNSYDLVYKWFDYLQQQGHHVTGFVIMPNHVHATIAFTKTKKSINSIIGDGKRFMGYEMIKRLQERSQQDVLEQLKNAVNISDKKKGQLHAVWEESFDWKQCNSEKFIMQKLDYMHANPFTGKWHLAENAIEYKHSSARFYITGEHGIYPVLNFRKLDDMVL